VFAAILPETRPRQAPALPRSVPPQTYFAPSKSLRAFSVRNVTGNSFSGDCMCVTARHFDISIPAQLFDGGLVRLLSTLYCTQRIYGVHCASLSRGRAVSSIEERHRILCVVNVPSKRPPTSLSSYTTSSKGGSIQGGVWELTQSELKLAEAVSRIGKALEMLV